MNETVLRISRGKLIENNAKQALISLDARPMIYGQPMTVLYYKDSSKNDIDAITVLGIKNGTGRDCYQIMASKSVEIITEIRYKGNEPGVAECYNGEKYLYVDTDNDNQLYYIYNEISGITQTRQVVPVTDVPKLYYIISDGTNLYVDKSGKLNTYVSSSELDTILKDYATKAYVSEEIAKVISGGTIDLKGYVKSVNGVKPDDSGNVEIDIPSTDTFLSKEEAALTYVKTISVNDGSKEKIDEEGNVDLDIDTTDTRLTSDMVDYLNDKLAYKYSYSISMSSSVSSIDLPSTIPSSITFVATTSATKKNDIGTVNLSISSVSGYTSGWNSLSDPIGTFEKVIDITDDMYKQNSISSGSLTINTIIDSDGKTGNASNSGKVVTFTKPWFIFESSISKFTGSDSKTLIEQMISGQKGYIKKERDNYNGKFTFSVDTSHDYIWFALPTTKSEISVIQLTKNVLSTDSSINITTDSTSIGTYKLYRWNEDLSAGEFEIDLIIK